MSKTVEMTESGNYFVFVYIFDGSGIDYIQMMQFPFNFSIIMVWNGG